MLRPERMSKVSVTGTRRVMPDVIEAAHDLNLLHLSDYDGSWEGFEPGNPMDGADEASERLVTVRSIESILGVDDDEAGPPREVSDEEIEAELEAIRTEVNELDDRRGELRDERREIEERIEAAEPFVDLGIDLDLLSGYDSVAVRAGEGDAEAVREAVADLGVPFEVFADEDAVAVVARTDGATLEEALVGVEFTAVEVPDAEGDPAAYVAELEAEREEVDGALDAVEDELEELEVEAGRFLLSAEERLTIEVQKAEAPLSFATTENAFVAEGWIPTDSYAAFEEGIRTAAGEHVEVEELVRADYDPPHGHAHETPEGADEGAVAADGGHVTDGDDPPVVQDNPDPVRPFELLVETISRPQYWDLDPTVVLFLTFPAFFGFMIGDLGYGILYVAIGYWLWTSFDSDALRSLGGIAMWAGGFTALFGILYGEFFGLHLISEYFWEGTLGLHGPPMEKGLSPASAEFAKAWLALVVIVGLLHVTLGYVFDFVQTLEHGLREAVFESGSWILLMVGVWVWILSRAFESAKPAFLFEAFDGHPFALGFAGFPAGVGWAALGIAAIGFVLMVAAEVEHMGLFAGALIGTLESLNVLVNVLSYARIAAVLLAKAGMAFVVNLLFFGVYAEGEPAAYHFMVSYGPQYVDDHYPEAEIVFDGLIHSGAVGVLAGLLILVLGHLLVLALGITSAGLQAVRLEYVEFFSKFYYEGGVGEEYEPFGYERPSPAE